MQIKETKNNIHIMKKIIIFCLCALILVPASLFAQAQRKADKQTAQFRYEIEPSVGQAKEGGCTVRVWTYSTKEKIAHDQACKNAVHGIIFKGYPQDGRLQGREPIVADPAIEAANKAYFDEFFKKGGDFQRYVHVIGSGQPDDVIKVGKELKTAYTVVVLVDQLRKRLENDGIIKPLDAVVGKLPTIMVVPSNTWCNKNGFMQKFENQGRTEYVPDYEKALLNNTDLVLAINTINTRMAKRGFPIKNLEAALKTVKKESAEDAMLTSKSGDAMAESPIDILRRTAKADIWIEIEWYENVKKGGSVKTLTYSMNALDAYTDVVVAGLAPTTGGEVYSSSFQIQQEIEAAIHGQFDGFCTTLQSYFDKLEEKGRAIKLRILTWDSFEDGLFAELDGDELHEIIEDWVADNTVKGQYSSADLSPSGNLMIIEQAYIPLVNEKGRDLDARTWARGLQKLLRNKYDIESNISAKGLGQIQLIIGGK